MHPLTIGITEVYKTAGNTGNAASAKAYMRNQFEFFGIPSPLRRAISKAYLQSRDLPPYKDLASIVLELYAFPQRELHYFAMELVSLYKIHWKKNIIELLEKLIITNSWWDTVDYIAANQCGYYFENYPAGKLKITGSWNDSDNFWLQRSSLLFQLKYKKETDKELLAQFIVHLAASKEFFVQKAIGWVLREFAKTDPLWVKKFVASYKLAPLSQREALRRIVN